MAERKAAARKRRQLQAGFGAGAALLLVVVGTVWLVSALGDDDENNAGASPSASAGAGQCVWIPQPKEGAPPTIKDVGVPPTGEPREGTRTMTLKTNLGDITATIDLSKTPCTAASFAHLASKKGYFDGSKCHRLVTEGIKVLQCGDPSARGKGWRENDGTGGPAYRFAEENLPTNARPAYPEGVIAMAKTQEPSTTGSQFFIVYGDTQLDPSYTVLGKVDAKGLAIVKDVAKAGTDNAFNQGDGHPKKELVINSLVMGPVS
jgi:peptidyl-prolyl cis-trans isomerase B (cyclophilin B)